MRPGRFGRNQRGAGRGYRRGGKGPATHQGQIVRRRLARADEAVIGKSTTPVAPKRRAVWMLSIVSFGERRYAPMPAHTARAPAASRAAAICSAKRAGSVVYAIGQTASTRPSATHARQSCRRAVVRLAARRARPRPSRAQPAAPSSPRRVNRPMSAVMRATRNVRHCSREGVGIGEQVDPSRASSVRRALSVNRGAIVARNCRMAARL